MQGKKEKQRSPLFLCRSCSLHLRDSCWTHAVFKGRPDHNDSGSWSHLAALRVVDGHSWLLHLFTTWISHCINQDDNKGVDLLTLGAVQPINPRKPQSWTTQRPTNFFLCEAWVPACCFFLMRRFPSLCEAACLAPFDVCGRTQLMWLSNERLNMALLCGPSREVRCCRQPFSFQLGSEISTWNFSGRIFGPWGSWTSAPSGHAPKFLTLDFLKTPRCQQVHLLVRGYNDGLHDGLHSVFGWGLHVIHQSFSMRYSLTRHHRENNSLRDILCNLRPFCLFIFIKFGQGGLSQELELQTHNFPHVVLLLFVLQGIFMHQRMHMLGLDSSSPMCHGATLVKSLLSLTTTQRIIRSAAHLDPLLSADVNSCVPALSFLLYVCSFWFFYVRFGCLGVSLLFKRRNKETKVSLKIPSISSPSCALTKACHHLSSGASLHVRFDTCRRRGLSSGTCLKGSLASIGARACRDKGIMVWGAHVNGHSGNEGNESASFKAKGVQWNCALERSFWGQARTWTTGSVVCTHIGCTTWIQETTDANSLLYIYIYPGELPHYLPLTRFGVTPLPTWEIPHYPRQFRTVKIGIFGRFWACSSCALRCRDICGFWSWCSSTCKWGFEKTARFWHCGWKSSLEVEFWCRGVNNKAL